MALNQKDTPSISFEIWPSWLDVDIVRSCLEPPPTLIIWTLEGKTFFFQLNNDEMIDGWWHWISIPSSSSSRESFHWKKMFFYSKNNFVNLFIEATLPSRHHLILWGTFKDPNMHKYDLHTWFFRINVWRIVYFSNTLFNIQQLPLCIK